MEEVQSDSTFNNKALALFDIHKRDNILYKKYLELVHLDQFTPTKWQEIPCLPIQFFKSHRLGNSILAPEKVFQSSGTGQGNRSKHYIPSLEQYQKNALRLFESRFGPLDDCIVLGLLPTYLDNPDSSLLAMTDYLMKMSKKRKETYFNSPNQSLFNLLLEYKRNGQKVILFTITYALLNLADCLESEGISCTIIETGGMKGLKKDWIKTELFDYVRAKIPNSTLVSEYGMTELQSQFYSDDNSVYLRNNERIKAKIIEVNDPLGFEKKQGSGIIHIIDLANANTMPFIATEDLGRKINEHQFEITGRMSQADLRGCNLLQFNQ